MPHITGPVGHRAVLEVLADQHFMRRKSSVLRVGAYIPLADDGTRFVYPGLIVAWETTAQSYYVPFSAGASYGAASGTACGVVREFHDASMGDPIIEPIFHGKMIEKHCYEWGGTVGTLTASVKTDLTMVDWV